MLVKKMLATAQVFEGSAGEALPADDLFSVQKDRGSQKHECYFRKSMGWNELPAWIVPAKGSSEDLYADVATFFPHWSPLSAHVHIFEKQYYEYIKNAEQNKGKPYVDGSSSRNGPLFLWAAIALGESATTALLGRDNDIDATYTLCRRSLAFSLARTSKLYPLLPPKIVTEKWLRLKKLSGTDVSLQTVDAVLSIANSLRSETVASNENVEGLPLALNHTLQAILRGISSSAEFSSSLSQAYPKISGLLAKMSGPFDDRMRAFEGLLSVVIEESISNMADSMAIGWFADQIMPGSFLHTKLVGRFLNKYPTILIWYALFAGLNSNFGSASPNLGIIRKLSRDINARFSLEESPQVDVSLDELEVLARVGLTGSAIRPIQPRAISVSLIPGVEVLTRFLPSDETFSSTERVAPKSEPKITEEKYEKLRNLLFEAQQLLSDNQNENAKSYVKKYPEKSKKLFR